MKMHFPIVLTALLALSCSESDNAFDPASLELAQRQQLITRGEYSRGEEKRYELKEVAEDRSAPEVASAAKNWWAMAQQVDKLTAERIALIEQLKKKLFKELGQSMEGENSIVMRAYDPKEPLQIALYDLWKTTTGGFTDLIGSGNRKELMESMQSYRNELTETVATYTSGEQQFRFKAPQVTRYANFEDLYRQIDQAMAASNVAVDDQEAVRKLYADLSRSEEQWEQLLHDDCHWVTAFHLLTELEYEILRARADALSLIRSRTGGCEYGFNQIMALTSGPEYAKAGSEIDFEVFVAAIDSYKQPIVTIDGGSAHLVETREGKGLVRVTVPNGASECEIAGKITIMNKSGIPKTLPWKKKIVIGK